MRSVGLLTWKAPAAMKRTWSVRTGPYFVETVVPSTIGQEVPLHALARDVRPVDALAPRDLVDLVEEDDARRLRALDGLARDLLLVDEARLLLLAQHLARLGDAAACGACVRPPKRPGSMSLMATSISSPPWLPRIWKDGHRPLGHLDLDGARVELARRAAARAASRASPASGSRARLVRPPAARPGPAAAGGSSRSRRRSSTRASAFSRTSACFSRRTMSTAAATRSRTIASTSRPT